jgi:hypothetical protein
MAAACKRTQHRHFRVLVASIFPLPGCHRSGRSPLHRRRREARVGEGFLIRPSSRIGVVTQAWLQTPTQLVSNTNRSGNTGTRLKTGARSSHTDRILYSASQLESPSRVLTASPLLAWCDMARSVAPGQRSRDRRRYRGEDNLPSGSNTGCKTCRFCARTEEAGPWISTYQEQGIHDLDIDGHMAVSKVLGKPDLHAEAMLDALREETTTRRGSLSGRDGRPPSTKFQSKTPPCSS